jgi:hypothetical protein
VFRGGLKNPNLTPVSVVKEKHSIKGLILTGDRKIVPELGGKPGDAGKTEAVGLDLRKNKNKKWANQKIASVMIWFAWNAMEE